MRGRKIGVFGIVVFGFIAVWALSGYHAFGAGKGTLSAGTAKVNITPKTPIPMSGCASRKDPFKGVHDEIFARVVETKMTNLIAPVTAGASGDINPIYGPHTVLKIGDIVFAGVSGEVFNEIGSALKKQSPYTYTIMITHCNGSSGYLITDKAYDEGGYEARSTRVKSGAEKVLLKNLLEMIYEL